MMDKDQIIELLLETLKAEHEEFILFEARLGNAMLPDLPKYNTTRAVIEKVEAALTEDPVQPAAIGGAVELKRWDLSADWDTDRTGKTSAWIRERESPAGKWVRFDDIPQSHSDVTRVVSREEAIAEYRQDELDAVMYFVDKWFESNDPRLKDNPANRAASAREIALRSIESLIPTPSATAGSGNLEDLLKRLDGLERFNPDLKWHGMLERRRGHWVRFEQVKAIVGQWIADQGAKS